ncbi:polyprenyl diphosphate synthase [Parvibium lacunae]
MDGNGRWAKARLLPRVAGHKKGVDAVREIVRACNDLGIPYLTLFAFSSENWRRPAEEVSLLMKLFITVLESEADKMHQHGIRLKVVGDIQAFDARLQALIRSVEEKTAANEQLTLTICANYGGRWDILQAAQAWVKANPDSDCSALTETALEQYLSMAYAPPPDLFIRTGGEERISNFLLWQMAYTELYFTQTYWPEFNRKALERAINSYQSRERRFGRTSEQIQTAST